MSALFRLGQRMAQRNNLTLFAWIAALVLPALLQIIATTQEDVRNYLQGYYGPFTFYFFFVMTYGFATIFVCYYQLSAYRRQGTLDMLRISRLTPAQVLRDVYLQLQRTLLPPVLGFLLVFTGYLALSPERATLMGFGGGTIAGGVINVVLSEMLLCAVICLGLLRNESPLALLSMLLVMPLNMAPIILMFFANGLREGWHIRSGESERMPLLLDWFTAVPWLFYVGFVMLLLALALWLARWRLAALWPPQQRPSKN
jgi:hypothetical protein